MPAAITQQIDQRAVIAAARGSEPVAPAKGAAKDEDDFSFGDLLDIINPLQHIPIVSTLYRAITGDTIKPVGRLAGDALYGGLWGFVSSFANLAFEKITGKDFGDTALALLTGDRKQPTALAAKENPQRLATGAPRQLSALASLGQTSGLDRGEDTAPATAFSAMAETHNRDWGLPTRAMAAYRRAVDLAPPFGAPNPIF